MPVRRLMHLTIPTVIVTVAAVIGTGVAHAQQREAVLKKVEVADVGFSIVIATARPGGATADYREQPDPNLVYLPAGNLVYPYTGDPQDLAADAIFTVPACSFHAARTSSSPRTPVVIYVMHQATMPPQPPQPGSQ